MHEHDLLKLENQLCHRFYSVSNAFTRAYRPLLKSLDITYPQYLVMMALWEQDNVTISQLVEKCRVDAGALTLILQKLAQKAFIVIKPSQHDKRVKEVVLTEKGQATKSEALQIPKQLLCQLQNLDAGEMQQLKVLIDKLYCELTTPQDRVAANDS
ncbi:MarR family winged helix-turn-helix transcriptional regulator [Marisediminitalea sp.]|uniref:MarR family winged helix-turn-helix transcriptional regulator n=1 Tax=Marisediminitalea sp. TaxID=2662268 RepID=UPI003518A64C